MADCSPEDSLEHKVDPILGFNRAVLVRVDPRTGCEVVDVWLAVLEESSGHLETR